MAKYTQSQLDALRSAYAQGVLVVGHGDKRVQYRSLAEMKQLIGEMERDLAGSSRPKRFALARVPRKGF